MENVHLVIMAGGIGSRFWPMSTPEMPKQFMDVLGLGKSLLQLTVDRFFGVIPNTNIWVVTSEKYKDIVKQQLPEVSEEHILLEPCMRNTAPCIAYATYKIKARYSDANLIFSPADHIVLDIIGFRNAIRKGLEFTATSDSILTLGMQPTRAETGYGYIKANKQKDDILKVEAFKEKPNLNVAKEYLKEECYFWNSGIFMWNVNAIVSELEMLTPNLAAKFEAMHDFFYQDTEQTIVNREFPSCENISIDYAVMEKSCKTYVLPASFGWSDLGTWGALHTCLNSDKFGNATVGNRINLFDCKNCIVHTHQEKKVVVQGLSDYIIAENDDTLLICKKEDEQRIKEWQT